MSKFSEDDVFLHRYNLDRVALAIQFLEKTNPDEDIKEQLSKWIVGMLTKETNLKKENNDDNNDR